jgi:hypothetical protein
MGALRPWHLLVLLCCLAFAAAVAVGIVLAIRASTRK